MLHLDMLQLVTLTMLVSYSDDYYTFFLMRSININISIELM